MRAEKSRSYVSAHLHMAIIQLREGQAELPSTNSTQSFWHQEPSPILTGHRTTSDLPSDADVVVVGSGITGAFAARELVRAGRSVVMLEAREACWGATGRVSFGSEFLIILFIASS